MKSLHVIGSRTLGGAEGFFMRLVLALQAAGEQVAAVDRARSLVAAELAGHVEQFHAPMSSPFDLWSRRKISRIVKRWRPDIVQTYMTRATVLTHLRPERGAVHVARLGGYYKVDRFRHAHAWIGNTRGICDFLVRGGVAPERVFLIGNFVASPAPTAEARLRELREQLGIAPDALVVTAMGRFVPKKGFDTLLDAFDRLPADVGGRPVHLLVGGDGPERERLHRQASRLRRAAQVHWPGWQTDTAPYYDLADVFVCPSRHEPLGNVILEGWTHAKPVVSTATVGAVELIAAGDDGLLTPVDDAAALAAALLQCLRDEGLRHRLADAGRRKVQSRFSQPAIVQQYLDLYRRLTRS